VISLVTAVLYEIVNLVYLRKHSFAGTGLDSYNLNGDPNHSKGGGGVSRMERPLFIMKGWCGICWWGIRRPFRC